MAVQVADVAGVVALSVLTVAGVENVVLREDAQLLLGVVLRRGFLPEPGVEDRDRDAFAVDALQVQLAGARLRRIPGFEHGTGGAHGTVGRDARTRQADTQRIDLRAGAARRSPHR